MRASRRYEIFLPLRFDDGQPVPESYLTDVSSELHLHFRTQVTRGGPHPENLMRLFLDVPDTVENREFFLQLKQKLKATFQQTDIWLISYPIEVL
jgi:hypothetical protein